MTTVIDERSRGVEFGKVFIVKVAWSASVADADDQPTPGKMEERKAARTDERELLR